MAPMKFEEKLKEKLEQRRLQPNKDAWSKLNAKLDNESSKGNNKSYWWIGIAASFVGVLIIVATQFNKNDQQVITPVVVDVEEVNQPPVKLENLQDKVNDMEVAKEEEAIKVRKEKKREPLNSNSKKDVIVKQKELIKINTKEVLAQTEQSESPKNEIFSKEPISLEDKKILEVVAQVEKLKSENKLVTDTEINALLDTAQKEIMLQRMMSADGKKVDAHALLESVEMDLEESFRDRAFKAIKSGYKYVKTAVVERNN